MQLLANRTNNRTYVASFCLLSVVRNTCIVAKRCILPENCLNKQIGFSDLDPYDPHFPEREYCLHSASSNACTANCNRTASVSSMVTIDSLQELTNALSNRTIADPLPVLPK